MMNKKILTLLPAFFIFTPLFIAFGEPVPKFTNYFSGNPLPEKTAYLTFDDGPSDWTERVLNILKEKDVKATFFICANWQKGTTIKNNSFQKYKQTLLRMRREGHSIGNHTRSHQNLAKLSREKIIEELDLNQKLLNEALETESFEMTLIRPPYGSPWMNKEDETAKKQLSEILLKKGNIMLWSRHFVSGDTKDWVKGDWYEEGPKVDITQEEFKTRMLYIYNRLIKRVDGKGMVVLFHDTHRTSTETLPKVIDKLKESGYKFDTMDGYIEWKNNLK